MSDKQETPRVTVSNYTKIWNLDWVIYALEGKKLPIPANLRVIGIFIVCELIFYILGKTILFFLPGAYTMLFLPFGATWLIAKQKLDGKAPHKWLLGMIYFWMRNKHLYRYRKFQYTKRYAYDSKVVYRTRRERE
ncbi:MULTISPECIES: TcpE family conjugal transfer membrane protein [unclassified Paenibacillus]|uniref:TcpE family conjugal transfer membrane protein n=1 Tax=unclassified Paenibacillus TaxID=185978 RepID=UPI00301B0F6A